VLPEVVLAFALSTGAYFLLAASFAGAHAHAHAHAHAQKQQARQTRQAPPKQEPPTATIPPQQPSPRQAPPKREAPKSPPARPALGISYEAACSILHVNEWTTQSEVHRSYRALAMAHHPDHTSGRSNGQMRDINLAYKTIRQQRGWE
jgi:DnaJ-domain-containing protein 1